MKGYFMFILGMPGVPTFMWCLVFAVFGLSSVQVAKFSAKRTAVANSLGLDLLPFWRTYPVTITPSAKYKGLGAYDIRKKSVLIPTFLEDAVSVIAFAILGHEVGHAQQHLALGKKMYLLDMRNLIPVSFLLAIGWAGATHAAPPMALLAVLVAYFLLNLVLEADASRFSLVELRKKGFSKSELALARGYLSLAWCSYAFQFAATMILAWILATNQFSWIYVAFRTAAAQWL